MLECDLDSSVPDWIIDHPESLEVFQEFGIDYGCGGKSLAFACETAGISPALVLARIRQVVHQRDDEHGLEMTPLLASIQVSLPRTLGDEGANDPMDRRWTTGFFKESVEGPVHLRTTNLDGDRQADLIHHGGPDKAVLAYSAEHYADWRQTMNILSLPFGAFGENFTVEGVSEADVCIGDIWQVGDEAVVQVSQPRQPCWKLARRWRIKSLALQVQQTGRTGWYFRVLKEGVVAAGMPMVLGERPHPDWTVERANRVMHSGKTNIAEALELAAIPLLSENWRTTLTRRVDKQEPDPSKRLIGENG
jgi:MOSC domain-containing protein YiiM